MTNDTVIYGDEKANKRKQIIRLSILYALLGFFALFIIIPFYWMILTAFKTEAQINLIPPLLWLNPADWQFVNFSLAMDAAPFGRFMANTVLVSFISTIGTVITTIFAAFAFSRLNFIGRDTLFMALIATMMIPGEMFVITNFMTVSGTFTGWWDGWLSNQTFTDAVLAMSLPFMTSIFYIFFLRQTFKQIPNELYYAAKVDGTTDLKYLWKVMVPIGMPTIITITILNAMGTWNAYIWPRLVTRQERFRLVSNGLRNAFDDPAGFTAYHTQMAAALLVTAPLLVVFLLLKKYIMRGVSRSGIKG